MFWDSSNPTWENILEQMEFKVSQKKIAPEESHFSTGYVVVLCDFGNKQMC